MSINALKVSPQKLPRPCRRPRLRCAALFLHSLALPTPRRDLRGRRPRQRASMGVAGWLELELAHKLRDFRIKTKHTHTEAAGLPSSCRVSAKPAPYKSSTIFSFDLNASINCNTFGAKRNKSHLELTIKKSGSLFLVLRFVPPQRFWLVPTALSLCLSMGWF